MTSRQINHTVRRQIKPSHTLMRLSVKRPIPNSKKQMRAQGNLGTGISSNANPPTYYSRRPSAPLPAVKKSPSVRHFAKTAASDISLDDDPTSSQDQPATLDDFLSQQVAEQEAVIEPSNLDYILAKALEQATNHEQPVFKVPSKLRRRVSNFLFPSKAKRAAFG